MVNITRYIDKQIKANATPPNQSPVNTNPSSTGPRSPSFLPLGLLTALVDLVDDGLQGLALNTLAHHARVLSLLGFVVIKLE